MERTGDHIPAALSRHGMPTGISQCPPPTIVLLIDCPREVAQDRFLSRQSPDRPEGTVEVFVKRASEYEKNNGEIVGRYEKAGVPYAVGLP